MYEIKLTNEYSTKLNNKLLTEKQNGSLPHSIHLNKNLFNLNIKGPNSQILYKCITYFGLISYGNTNQESTFINIYFKSTNSIGNVSINNLHEYDMDGERWYIYK